MNDAALGSIGESIGHINVRYQHGTHTMWASGAMSWRIAKPLAGEAQVHQAQDNKNETETSQAD